MLYTQESISIKTFQYSSQVLLKHNKGHKNTASVYDSLHIITQRNVTEKLITY